MCLFTKNNANVAYLTPTTIVVYKTISKNNKSQHKGFEYKANTLYDIGEPLTFKRISGSINYNYCHTVNVGFHAYVNFKIAKKYVPNYYKIVEFIIPIGSEIAWGLNDDIVSNKIIAGDLEDIPRNVFVRLYKRFKKVLTSINNFDKLVSQFKQH